MDRDRFLEGLIKRFVGGEPEGIPDHLSVLRANTVYAQGTSVPLAGALLFRHDFRGIWVPNNAQLGPHPVDYFGIYVVLGDYLNLSDPSHGIVFSTNEIIEHLIRQLSVEEWLTELAVLDSVSGRPSELEILTNRYLEFWEPVTRSRLAAALQDSVGEPPKRLMTRQAILTAMRRVLLFDENLPALSPELPATVLAILLIHAIASTLSADVPTSGEPFGGLPAHLSVELTQNELFHQSDDIFVRIDRQTQLWREVGTRLERISPRLPPADMLREAAGIELEDILALGLALYAQRMSWKLGQAIWWVADFNSDLPPETIERFLGLVSVTRAELRQSLESAVSRWDFMPFCEHPVLRDGDRILILDEKLLADRILSGLYWIVHEHERRLYGKIGWRRWTHAYGEMIELLVEDHLRSMALPALNLSGRTYYDEADFAKVYHGKVCDVALDFGSETCLIEIVSGQLTRATRFEGSVEGLKADTEKLVFKKACQLDESSKSFLQDPSALRRYLSPAGLPSPTVFPVIVAGEGYPINPATLNYITTQARDRGLLADSRIQPLFVIDIGELEMLWALAERGNSLPTLLDAWHKSAIRSMPLRNFLISQY